MASATCEGGGGGVGTIYFHTLLPIYNVEPKIVQHKSSETVTLQKILSIKCSDQ